MFEWYRIVEYVGVALGAALLYALCAGRSLGALQQAGYNGKKYAAWVRRKGNMVRSRNTLLAFLIALSMLVLGVCFSFAGRWAAYIALAPILLFTVIFCIADRRALKVPLVRTARAARIWVLDALVLFVCAAALAVGANALWIEVWPQVELVEHLRYLPLAVLPLLFPELLRLANLLERPFSAAKNRRCLAAAKKQLLTAPCVKIAVTGSCGKTSVKNFLAGILGERWRVFATPASYNTPLGIARAIEGVDLSQYDCFIAEMGARHKGDIAELCELVRPDHCIITGICPQHLETFGTVEGIVAAKGEILRGTKRGGFAVIGQDEYTDRLDPAAAGLKKVAVGEHGEFGALGVFCSPEGIDFDLALGILQMPVHARLLGAHNAQNIALAAALAAKLGMEKEEIAAGIAKLDFVPHRLQPIYAGGVVILDDAYNANVRGAAAALDVLRLFGGRKFVVTPGLVELGVLEEGENAALGEKMVGLDGILLVGSTLVTAVRRGYLAAGGIEGRIAVYPTLDAAKEALAAELVPGDTVLFLNDLPDIDM